MSTTLFAFLASKFDYCPTTGTLTKKRTGKAVGTPNKGGYLTVGVKFEGRVQRFYVHRIAMMFILGEDLPEGMSVHHINAQRDCNIAGNLKLVSHTENIHAQERCKTKLYGAHLQKLSGNYQARVTVKGKRYSLGTYATAERASQVACEFLKKQGVA